MPVRLYRDGSELHHPNLQAMVAHRGCPEHAQIRVMLTLCRDTFVLDLEEVDEVLEELRTAREKMLDTAADFEDEAQKNHDGHDENMPPSSIPKPKRKRLPKKGTGT